jgi:hypothetical protein
MGWIPEAPIKSLQISWYWRMGRPLRSYRAQRVAGMKALQSNGF